uniref:ubiquitinyl hydrolase 1 n=1 Tax=Mola mola TaxID=94237 RepID=A0A3Q3WJD6_MOLML
MNAVVQCLSNTDLLAEYLGLERYKLDLGQTRMNGVVRSNEARSANGEVTEQLASLVRALWTLEYIPQLSVDFKTIVSKYGSQFRGNSQHDALEFLLWLLDRVHEDVNLASHNNNNITNASGKKQAEAVVFTALSFLFLPHSAFLHQLAPDDAWKCPHCKQLQQGMVKMSLWTLPDILILHLKRFRQVGERRNKLTTFVHFPLAGLDMAPHMVNQSHPPASQPGWKPSRRPELAPPHFLYDLYAVCNHHGGMHAFCRNSVDGQWYSYDDSSAEAVPEAEVCTRGAYILFYQRRNNIPPWSASSSVTG